ncbi:MAG: NUDIX domain-containing protein [Terriglobales bacterium]
MSTVPQPPTKFIRLAHLRRLRGCHQVAAICYRVRSAGIEFLLVQTRGSGRWTFPKGGSEPGLTHAQAAALEAFEEAGVHGRMEEVSFASYLRGISANSRKSTAKAQVVNAHLCEVTRLEAPLESGRNPTWFSPEKAKRCLREDRGPDCAAEMARLVDRAVARIQRQRLVAAESRPAESRPKDGLQKVQFIDCAWRTVDTPKASAGTGKPRRQFLN